MLNSIPKSHFYALATVALWSIPYAGARAIMLEGYIGATELGVIRNTVAAAFFAALLLFRHARLPAIKDFPFFLLAGFLGFTFYMAIFNHGLETINGATSSILLATTPLVSALLATFIFAEKLPLAAWGALALAFAGTAVLSLWGQSLTINTGIFWTLGAAICISLCNIIQRHLSRRARGAHYTPVQITGYCFIAAALLSLPFMPVAAAQFAAAPPHSQILAVFMGLVPSAIGILCWTKALSIAGSTSSVVNYMFLTPFLALVLCYFWLDELPGMGTFVGGAVICAGLWLFSRSTHARQPQLVTNKQQN